MSQMIVFGLVFLIGMISGDEFPVKNSEEVTIVKYGKEYGLIDEISIMIYPALENASEHVSSRYLMSKDCKLYIGLELYPKGRIDFKILKQSCELNDSDFSSITDYFRDEVRYFVLEKDYRMKSESIEIFIPFTVRNSK